MYGLTTVTACGGGMYGLTTVTAPTAEPLDRETLKPYLRIDADDVSQDGVIDDAIATARDYAERFLDRQLMSARLAMTLDRFPAGGVIELPRVPLQSVVSVVYTDTADVDTTLATTNYTVDSTVEPGRIVQAYGVTWPVVILRPGGLVVTFDAGYADANAIPPTVLQAMRLLVGFDFANREATKAEMDRVHSLLRLAWDGSYR